MNPIERAVPSIIRIADSIFAAFKSGILVSAISCTCARVTVATLVVLGVPEPFSTPAAFFQKEQPAGGVLVTKSNDLSSYTEITTGIIMPA